MHAQEHGSVRSLIGINNTRSEFVVGIDGVGVAQSRENAAGNRKKGGKRLKSSQVSSTCEREGAVSDVFVVVLWDRKRI